MRTAPTLLRAPVGLLVLLALVAALPGCARRAHRSRAIPFRSTAPDARASRERWGPDGRRMCCDFYELCVLDELGGSGSLAFELCADCMGQHCVPGGVVSWPGPSPCVRPSRPVEAHSVRVHVPYGPVDGVVLQCRCECLARVVIHLTSQGAFADLYTCRGGFCEHVLLLQR